MATFTVTALNAALDGVGALGAWVGLHTADPLGTGANELTGGSPAYARKQTTWSAAGSAIKLGSAQTFDIPASTTVGWFSIWTAASGGAYLGGGPLRNAGNSANITEVFNQQGQFAITPRMTADTIALT